MEFKDIVAKANEVRNSYKNFEKRTYGKTWTRKNITEGLASDVGDLMKLVYFYTPGV